VGTFWYHPHVHPLSTQSAYGGAYGILIVDETTAVVGNQRFYPKHLSNFLTENEILLQFSSMYDEKLPNPVRSNKVNGQDSLDLFLSPDAYYYFRVSSVVYAESVNYLEFDPPDACDVRVIAYDGVYRSEVPGPSSLHKHMMTVSSRGDFSVVCTKDADVHFHQGEPSDESKMVTIRLEKESLRSSCNGPTSVFLPATLPSSPYWDPNAETIWKPRRPYYMHDLSGPTNLVDQFWSVSMDDYFVNGTKGHSLNQHVWDPNKSIRTFDLGQLLEYPILLSQKHPYHTHINRMQIVEPGGCGGRFEEGEYFDTISQSTDTCLVRTKFFDFAGRVVIHCHRFEHEDHGMMSVSIHCSVCSRRSILCAYILNTDTHRHRHRHISSIRACVFFSSAFQSGSMF
jgi:FtsP/CotA-like multicopper oxidase with cupredoxin domain